MCVVIMTLLPWLNGYGWIVTVGTKGHIASFTMSFGQNCWPAHEVKIQYHAKVICTPNLVVFFQSFINIVIFQYL